MSHYALKPCPFCGGEAIIINEDRTWVECADCPSKVGVGPFNVEAEAIDAWNIRADLVPKWQPVSDETPADVILLLGWHGFGDKWETTTDYYNSTRGGWYHGSATHWMPLPEPPHPTARHST